MMNLYTHSRGFSRRFTYLCSFLLLIAPIAAIPFEKVVPPPLPAEEWEGKSSIDYRAKHEQYADLLVCLWIPLGTIGSMLWYTVFVATVYSLLTAARPAEKNKSPWPTIQGIITIAWAIYALVQVSLTIRDCRHRPHFEDIRTVVYVLLASEICNLLAPALIALNIGRKLAIGACCLTILLMWLSALIATSRVVKLQMPDTKLNFLLEQVSLEAKIPAIIVWVLMSIGGFALGLKIASKREFRSVLYGICCCCIFLVTAVFIGIFGFVFVYLGNIIGSPWGVYYLKNLYGQLTAGLTAVAAALETIVLAVLVV